MGLCGLCGVNSASKIGYMCMRCCQLCLLSEIIVTNCGYGVQAVLSNVSMKFEQCCSNVSME